MGGGDLRASVGSAARILEVTELDEGQVGVIAIGDRRITVEAWLPDDPYPQAFVFDNPRYRRVAEKGPWSRASKQDSVGCTLSTPSWA